MAVAHEHAESVRGTWQGGFRGAGRVAWDEGSVAIAAPSRAGGSGDGSGPSSLLVAAAGGCYLLTLAAILEQASLAPLRLELETTGHFRSSMPPELSRVEHRPVVTLAPEQAARRGLVVRCFERAKTACPATRAMAGVTFSVSGLTRIEEPSSAGDDRAVQT